MQEPDTKNQQEMKPCPLCGTLLPYDKWLKVVGVYEEQQRYRKQLELELAKAKQNSQKLKEEYQKIKQKEKDLKAQYKQKLKEEKTKLQEVYKNLKEKEKNIKSEFNQKFKEAQEKLKLKFEKEKQKALEQVRKEGIKIGSEKEKAKAEKLKNELLRIKQNYNLQIQQLTEKFKKQEELSLKRLERQKQRELKQAKAEAIKLGIEKQKARTEKVEKMLEKVRQARDEAMERVKQLEEMIKKGSTPQLEGFDFERELINQLKQKFPDDDIKLTGKKGDILHTVQVDNKKIGKILYECKKTKDFDPKYIKQAQRDKAKAVADYALIVTWALKENKQPFWIEEDIMIIHPYGVLDFAFLLREILLQMYTLKISKEEFETKGKALLEFMQSEEFRARIQDSVNKGKEAYELLKKEVKTHVSTWKKRYKIYESIYANSNIIQGVVRYILLHGKIPEKLPEIKGFPVPYELTDKTEKQNQKE